MIVAQISDTHVTHEGQGIDVEFSTARRLREAVEHLSRLPAVPAAVVVTGDCVDGGSVAEYQRFRDLLRPLEVPVYIVAGNHDDRDNLRQVFGVQGSHSMTDFVQFVVEDGPVRLLMLDSLIPGQHEGDLCARRLAWLEDRLTEEPARPTMIFLHHPPFSLGPSAINEMNPTASQDFGRIVARFRNVERVAAGHFHCSIQRDFFGTVAVTCPSTSHQLSFDLLRPYRFSVTPKGGACLLHAWSPEHGLLTFTSAIPSN